MARLVSTSIPALDGYPLRATYYEPFEYGNHNGQIAVINSGAGIPKTFYEPFATWLADQGIIVITYDYRGIGSSRGNSIRRLSVSIQDWGSKDCAGVLLAATKRYPWARLSVIGHSIGSIVTGFVRNPPKIERLLLICPHTGYSGDYAKSGKLSMLFLWHMLMPIATQLSGYFPGRLLGLPEDLPYGIAMEWSSRCETKDRNAQELDHRAKSFLQITSQALVLRPRDDPFSTRPAVNRVKKLFSSIEFEDVQLDTDAHASLGHFGFFKSSSREHFWPMALSWLRIGVVSR